MVQYWTDQEVLRPIGEAHGGRGRHRRYDLTEVRLAIIAAYLDSAGFSTDSILEATLKIRAIHEQCATSPLDVALDPSHNFHASRVQIWLNYWPTLDEFRAELEEKQFEPFDSLITLILPIDVWFAELRNRCKATANSLSRTNGQTSNGNN